LLFDLHPPITAPSKLRLSFSTSFGNSKTSTLGLVPMQSVTNLGPRHHQGKKVYFVRVRLGLYHPSVQRIQALYLVAQRRNLLVEPRVASGTVGPWRSALSSCERYRAMLSSICSSRRCILAMRKRREL
jgi:hypothetical protein